MLKLTVLYSHWLSKLWIVLSASTFTGINVRNNVSTGISLTLHCSMLKVPGNCKKNITCRQVNVIMAGIEMCCLFLACILELAFPQFLHYWIRLLSSKKVMCFRETLALGRLCRREWLAVWMLIEKKIKKWFDCHKVRRVYSRSCSSSSKVFDLNSCLYVWIVTLQRLKGNLLFYDNFGLIFVTLSICSIHYDNTILTKVPAEHGNNTKNRSDRSETWAVRWSYRL